jgi:hypothetical protein
LAQAIEMVEEGQAKYAARTAMLSQENASLQQQVASLQQRLQDTSEQRDELQSKNEDLIKQLQQAKPQAVPAAFELAPGSAQSIDLTGSDDEAAGASGASSASGAPQSTVGMLSGLAQRGKAIAANLLPLVRVFDSAPASGLASSVVPVVPASAASEAGSASQLEVERGHVGRRIEVLGAENFPYTPGARTLGNGPWVQVWYNGKEQRCKICYMCNSANPQTSDRPGARATHCTTPGCKEERKKAEQPWIDAAATKKAEQTAARALKVFAGASAASAENATDDEASKDPNALSKELAFTDGNWHPDVEAALELAERRKTTAGKLNGFEKKELNAKALTALQQLPHELCLICLAKLDKEKKECRDINAFLFKKAAYLRNQWGLDDLESSSSEQADTSSSKEADTESDEDEVAKDKV